MDDETISSGLQRIAPVEVRYIKLGEKGALAEACVKQGLIVLQHIEAPHELADRRDWEAVRDTLAARSDNPGTVTRWVNEVRDFYSLGTDTLWITFHAGHLWWGFAEETVLPASDTLHPGGRFRRMIGNWRKTDIAGNPLNTDRISSQLTRTAAFRGTICSVAAADHALRLINCEENPRVLETRHLRSAFEASLVGIIRSLHEKDFEILTDLIFHRLGWQRVGELGGSQADTDFVLVQPATGKRGLVQIKSSATQDVVEDYGARFSESKDALPFLVCHSPAGSLRPPVARPDMLIWNGEDLARKVSEAGLVDWLLGHAA